MFNRSAKSTRYFSNTVYHIHFVWTMEYSKWDIQWMFSEKLHRDLETFEQYHLNDCMGTSSVHQVSPAVSLFNLVTKTHDALFY